VLFTGPYLHREQTPHFNACDKPNIWDPDGRGRSNKRFITVHIFVQSLNLGNVPKRGWISCFRMEQKSVLCATWQTSDDINMRYYCYARLTARCDRQVHRVIPR
jgi:hypothetical protein